MPFISSSEAKNAYFMSGEPRMKYAFFASRNEINGMFIPKRTSSDKAYIFPS